MQMRFTKSRAAITALFVLAGVGLGNLLSPLIGTALATVGTVSNISDHSSSAYFATVDSTGKLAVGDGSGPLSVDGTVVSRPAAPASPWRASEDIEGQEVFIAGPSAAPINVTSLSVSTDQQSGGGVNVYLYAHQVSSSATTCGGTIVATLWHIRDAGDGVTPLSFTFPTPLQFKPAANMKACLTAYSDTLSTTTLNAVGFYGG